MHEAVHAKSLYVVGNPCVKGSRGAVLVQFERITPARFAPPSRMADGISEWSSGHGSPGAPWAAGESETTRRPCACGCGHFLADHRVRDGARLGRSAGRRAGADGAVPGAMREGGTTRVIRQTVPVPAAGEESARSGPDSQIPLPPRGAGDRLGDGSPIKEVRSTGEERGERREERAGRASVSPGPAGRLRSSSLGCNGTLREPRVERVHGPLRAAGVELSHLPRRAAHRLGRLAVFEERGQRLAELGGIA